MHPIDRCATAPVKHRKPIGAEDISLAPQHGDQGDDDRNSQPRAGEIRLGPRAGPTARSRRRSGGGRESTRRPGVARPTGRRIPIWLGTFGPRALDLTGRLADGWIPSLELAPPERVPAMRERILRGAQQADRNPEDITLAYNMEIRVDERTDGPPHVVTGSPSAVAEQLVGFTRLGFSAMNFQPWGPGRDEQIERLATEVIPAVRDVIG